jgi:hypothetical protein
MNYYLAKRSKLNFLISIQRGIWTQAMNRMSAWKPKDRLILYAKGRILGLSEVTFFSEWFFMAKPKSEFLSNRNSTANM